MIPTAMILFALIGVTRALSSPDIASPGDSNLLELGHASNIREASSTPSDLKIISYNIRWRSGEDLQKLAAILKSDDQLGGAAIMGLQEVDRNKQRSGKTNTVRLLAEELGMYYAWAAPPAPGSNKRKAEEETGVAILSVYPLSDVRRIVLPYEGPGHRRRVALGATVTIGKTRLRFYSVHSETRIAIKRKLEQLEAVLRDLDSQPATTPAIIVGDFNTWEPEAVAKTFKLFLDRGFSTPFDDHATFSRRIFFMPIELKLDWIWLRNLDSDQFGIASAVRLSDHWPLWASIRFPPSQTKAN